MAYLSQIAAPPLPASSSLNLLTRIAVSMCPIADHALKRQQNSAGGGRRQLTILTAALPQVALEPAVVVPTDIECSSKAIVVGVVPPHNLSADKKRE